MAKRTHSTSMKFSEKDYNHSQLNLSFIGKDGQEKLSSSKVVVIGAGGLGSALLPSLVGVNLHTVTVVEHDSIDVTNLHRQPLYSTDDLGLPKCAIATQRLKKLNPFVNIISVPEKVTNDNIDDIIKKHHLIIDCTDNFATKFLIHDKALKHGIDFISGAVNGLEGKLSLFKFSKTLSPCQRCLWPDPPSTDHTSNHVLGPIVGILGQMMALEAIKLLTGHPTINQGEEIIFNGIDIEITKLRWQDNPECSTCH